MVDAARQMLDELMGRNRNLHPSEASRKVNWDDPDFCQYHIVRFCPHDLFINTRADLGPCPRIHDDEAKQLYEEARPTPRKRQYEDEFMRFCNTMLNDVDRKIQKGKQRLQLMHRDQPMPPSQPHVSKYQEQLNNINARIKKLLSEAEEAGIRGDVDQAQDLMTLCEQLKDEKDQLVAEHENNTNNKDIIPPERPPPSTSADPEQLRSRSSASPTKSEFGGVNSPASSAATAVAGSANDDDGAGSVSGAGDKKLPPWMHDLGTLPEKQMEVCEVCGAFLIVGDAQQRIEDHLMGKQHLGYSRLRKAVDEIYERRKNERDEEERKRREERNAMSAGQQQPTRNAFNAFADDHRRRDRDHRDHRDRRDREHSHRGHSRDYSNHQAERHRHHHKTHHRRRSHSRSSSSRSHHRHSSRDRRNGSRSRSRSRY